MTEEYTPQELYLIDDETPFRVKLNELHERLVPPIGTCETLQGEILRALGNLWYDWQNNGGGNNTSGSLNFLRLYLHELVGAENVPESLFSSGFHAYTLGLFRDDTIAVQPLVDLVKCIELHMNLDIADSDLKPLFSYLVSKNAKINDMGCLGFQDNPSKWEDNYWIFCEHQEDYDRWEEE